MTPRRPRLGEPTHVWLISDATGKAQGMRHDRLLSLADFPLHWSAKKIELHEAHAALSTTKPMRSLRKRAGDVVAAVRALLWGAR